MQTSLRALCLWLAGCALLLAQSETGQPAPTKGFTIAVLQGDGVLNPLPRPPATHLSIRVADSKGSPIRNAVAVFEFPEAGASAIFPDGSSVKVLLTNERGEAIADVKSNEVPGKYQAVVTVNYLGQSSLVRLNQENVFPFKTPAAVRKHGFFTKRTALIVGGSAVVATIAVIASHRGGNQNTTTPPPSGITITPGTGTVGGH
jgi:hypothetical protein